MTVQAKLRIVTGLLLAFAATPAPAQTTTATTTGPASAPATAPALPVRIPEHTTETPHNIGYLLSLDQLAAAIKDGPAAGLVLDLAGCTTLLDGTTIDPANIHGTAAIGPCFSEGAETGIAARRLARGVPIQAGKAVLPLADMLASVATGPNGKTRGQITLRLDLHLSQPGPDRPLGVYTTFAGFRRADDGFQRQPCLVDGPLLGRLSSDDPTSAIVSFTTSEPIQAKVILEGKRAFSDTAPATHHQVELTGLESGKQYAYRVEVAGLQTPDYTFMAAPPRGVGGSTFAFLGHSAAGQPCDAAGLDPAALDRMLALARRSATSFLVMGGNLVSGRTSSPADLAVQLSAWKQAAAAFGRTRPIYTLMGAGESCGRSYPQSTSSLLLDRWPYATDSAEAVFATAFANPASGPAPSDSRRPPYRGSVYTFQFGATRIISLNNHYWYASDPKVAGGCPEGYMLNDQMLWLAQQLAAADKDETVKYIVVCLAQPVLPNAGGVTGGMWAGGDNTPRPHTYDPRTGKLMPAGKGLLEMRNDFLRMMDRSSKLAAVVSSGEPGYHRMLLDNQVPVGDPARDDKAGTGRLGPTFSPLTDLEHGTWLLSSGGIGAAPQAEQPTPWNTFYEKISRPNATVTPDKLRYRFTPQETLLTFQALPDRINLTVYGPNGETIERIPDLLRFKREKPLLGSCCIEGPK